ncbi:hypothetical protein Tco_1401667 [Tanacetum coccineum]
MSTPKFASTHNLVVFLEKPKESQGFEQIIDFLNASHVKYALTVNPTIYSSCIKQFWATAKVHKVNDQEQIQALVDKKKIIIIEESIRRDLKLQDAEGSTCLPNATIFEELARMGAKSTAWNEFSSTMASAIICLANNQKFNFSNAAVGEDSDHSADLNQTPIDAQSSTSSQPQKKLKPRRRQRKETEDHVPTSSNDPLPSGKDSSNINELKVCCLSLQEQVFDLQKEKDAQAKEIATLKKTVKKLQRKKRSKSVGLRKLKKIGGRKSKSSKVTEGLGDQEDSSKQGRRIEAINADDEVTLEAQREDDDLMFDTLVSEEDEVVAENAKEPEVVTTVSGPTTTTDELTLAQTLIEIAKSKKVEAITTAAISVTTAAETRLKAKGIVFHEIEQTHSHRPIISSQPSSKDKGKAIMIELKRPLKRKEEVAADEEYAKQLAAEIEAEVEKEERERRQKEEEANLALIELWENKQAMMEADRLLCERLQAREREELTIKEKSKLFVEFINKNKKHFAELRAKEKRNKPPTKAQKRNVSQEHGNLEAYSTQEQDL